MALRKLLLLFLLSLFTALASAQPAGTPEQLLERCKQAFVRKDIRAYIDLVALNREADRAGFEAQFRHAAQQPLRSAKLLPLSAYQASYDRALKRGMKPSVQVEGWIELEFEAAQLPGGVVEKSSVVLLYGRKDGGYFLGS
ncbi:hypothetical protein [Roseateles sp.]|uniref:hypothetical protein n=1 Tax=Roseateles sp. TaxID=1971397 RepID=UPI003BA559B5